MSVVYPIPTAKLSNLGDELKLYMSEKIPNTWYIVSGGTEEDTEITY